MKIILKALFSFINIKSKGEDPPLQELVHFELGPDAARAWLLFLDSLSRNIHGGETRVQCLLGFAGNFWNFTFPVPEVSYSPYLKVWELIVPKRP